MRNLFDQTLGAGSEDAPMAERARAVWVDFLMSQYLDMPPAEHGAR